MMLLQAKQAAYYSILLVTGVEHGVGVAVHDVLRGDKGFLVDVDFGTSARAETQPERGFSECAPTGTISARVAAAKNPSRVAVSDRLRRPESLAESAPRSERNTPVIGLRSRIVKFS